MDFFRYSYICNTSINAHIVFTEDKRLFVVRLAQRCNSDYPMLFRRTWDIVRLTRHGYIVSEIVPLICGLLAICRPLAYRRNDNNVCYPHALSLSRKPSDPYINASRSTSLLA